MLAKFGKKMGQGKDSTELYGNNLPDQIIRTFKIFQGSVPHCRTDRHPGALHFFHLPGIAPLRNQ